MPNNRYQKLASGLVKSCAYDKHIMPPPTGQTSVKQVFKSIPQALTGKKKMPCPMMGDGSCTAGRTMATRQENPDGGFAWFDNRLKALETAINGKKWGNAKKNVTRLNKFIQAVKTYNKTGKEKMGTQIDARVFGLKWYSHAIHERCLKIANNKEAQNKGIFLQLNDIIYCHNNAVAGCNNGTWESSYAATNANCMKKQPKAAFGSTVKSKAKPLIKPSTATKETTKKWSCASKLSNVIKPKAKKYNSKTEAEKNCDLSREYAKEVPAWAGGRKSRRRRRRRSRKKGRKSRKSRRRNKRKSRKRRSRRKSRKRRRR